MKKNIKFLTLSLTFLLATNTVFAQTESPGSIALGFTAGVMNVLGGVAGWFLSLVGFFAGLLFSIGGFLIDYAIQLNLDVLTSPIVEVGWLISRDITNLGLVAAVVIMAFATMLRSSSYGLKQVLFKVVAVALLINFSLTITGVFLDFSHVLTNYFVTKASPPSVLSFGTSLAAAFNPQALLEVTRKQDKQGAIGQLGGGLFSFLGGLFFSVLFTILGAITFLGIACMLLARYVALGLLLITMPLAWLAWILPGLGGYQKMWWDGFIKWTLFAPAVTFFLYLAIFTTLTLGDEYKKIAKEVSAGKVLEAEFPGGLSRLGNMIIALGLMMGGLVTANKLGIVGAQTFYGAATAVTGWAQGKITGAAKGAGLFALRHADRAATSGLRNEEVQKKAEDWQKNGGWIKRQAGVALNYIGRGQAQRLGKNAEDLIKDLPPDQLAYRLQDMSRDKQVAALSKLAKEGKINMVPNVEKFITEDMKNSFVKYGNKGFEDVEKAALKDIEMVKAQKESDEANKKDGANISKENDRVQLATAYKSKSENELEKARLEAKNASEEEARIVHSSLDPDELDKAVNLTKQKNRELLDAQAKNDDADKILKERTAILRELGASVTKAEIKLGARTDQHFSKYSQADMQKYVGSKDIIDEKFGPNIAQQVLRKSPGAVSSILSKAVGENLQSAITVFKRAQEEMLENLIKKAGVADYKITKPAKFKDDNLKEAGKRIESHLKTLEGLAGKLDKIEINRMKKIHDTLSGGITKRLYGYVKEEKKKEEAPGRGGKGGGEGKKS